MLSAGLAFQGWSRPSGPQFPPPIPGLQPEQKQAPSGQAPASHLGSMVPAQAVSVGRLAQLWGTLDSVRRGYWQCPQSSIRQSFPEEEGPQLHRSPLLLPQGKGNS